jgi:hypothetical protein
MSNGRVTLQNREDARREGRRDGAGGEFPDLQSGVREGAVRLEMRQGAKPRRGRVWGLGGAGNRTQKKCGTDDSPTLRTLQASEA